MEQLFKKYAEWSVSKAVTRLQEGRSMTVEDRIFLLGMLSLILIGIFIFMSAGFNPKYYRRRLEAKRKAERQKRSWKILKYFYGSLFPERQLSEKQSRIHVLQRLTLSDDLCCSSAACSILIDMADDISAMIPSLLSGDLFTLCRMSSVPAPSVAQRIPACLALLCCSPANRDTLCSLPPAALRSVVAGARAASRLKQAGSALAALTLAQSRNAATLLIRMGILDPLGAMLDDRRGVSAKSGGESRRLAAALALARLAERGGEAEDRRPFATQAFLRAVAGLGRAEDQRLQLCAASIFAALAATEVVRPHRRPSVA